MNKPPPPLLVAPSRIQDVVGISKTTAYRLLKSDPDFPQLVRVGERSSYWRLTDLQTWVRDLEGAPKRAPRRPHDAK